MEDRRGEGGERVRQCEYEDWSESESGWMSASGVKGEKRRLGNQIWRPPRKEEKSRAEKFETGFYSIPHLPSLQLKAQGQLSLMN